MANFRNSVALLKVGGQHVGSAWLVTPNIACTANHCVADCAIASEVTLEFPSENVTGRIVVLDRQFDIALIQFDSPIQNVSPLLLIARPLNLTSSTRWLLHGYPVQNAEFHEGGLTLEGTVSNGRAGSVTGPLMQLHCIQGTRLGNQDSVFGGVSGSPVVVCPRDSEEPIHVIGVTSHHHIAQDNILYCTPIDEVFAKYNRKIFQSELKSWDAMRRLLFVVRDEHGFRTNLDEQLMQSIWQDGLTDLWCNLMTDESPVLTSAIERIVVQAPFAKVRPNTDLHFNGASAWKSRCECCASEWVPVDGTSAKRTLEKYAFVELDNTTIPLGGIFFNDLNDLANLLKSLCNKWALKRLRMRVSEAFDNPLGELQYEVAADLITPMRNLWTEWLKILTKEEDTLHHFFGLMLCGDGGVFMESSAAGTGPETIDACVLRATIFSLAVCVALPIEIQRPRGNTPGNLGIDEMSGKRPRQPVGILSQIG